MLHRLTHLVFAPFVALSIAACAVDDPSLVSEGDTGQLASELTCNSCGWDKQVVTNDVYDTYYSGTFYTGGGSNGMCSGHKNYVVDFDNVPLGRTLYLNATVPGITSALACTNTHLEVSYWPRIGGQTIGGQTCYANYAQTVYASGYWNSITHQCALSTGNVYLTDSGTDDSCTGLAQGNGAVLAAVSAYRTTCADGICNNTYLNASVSLALDSRWKYPTNTLCSCDNVCASGVCAYTRGSNQGHCQ